MTGLDPDHLLPDLDRLRARVRADQRATSAPVLAFGALIVGYAAVVGLYAGRLHAEGRHLTVLLYWPLATTVGLVALWWSAHRRAGAVGVGEGRHPYRSVVKGYLVALALIVVLFIPILFIGVFTPLIWPAAVLASLAAWQHNRSLGVWAAAIALVGVVAGLSAAAGQDGTAWWWVQPVVHAALGLALVAGGVVTGRRERATS